MKHDSDVIYSNGDVTVTRGANVGDAAASVRCVGGSELAEGFAVEELQSGRNRAHQKFAFAKRNRARDAFAHDLGGATDPFGTRIRSETVKLSGRQIAE